MTNGAGAAAVSGGDNGGEAAPAGGQGGADLAQTLGLDQAAFTSLQAKGFIGETGLNSGKLAQSYTEMERKMGSMLSAPDPAKMKEWSGWAKLGAPNDPSGYDMNLALPEGATFDKALADRIAKRAHAERAPAHIVRAMSEEFATHVAEATTARAAELEAAGTRLQGELKSTFGGDLDARTARAQKAFRVLTENLTKTGDGSADAAMVAENLNKMVGDAGIVLLFDRIAEAMGEDRLMTGEHQAGAPATLEQAQTAIDNLRKDAAHMKAYNDKADPGHADAVKKMNAAYGEKSRLSRRGDAGI